MSRSALALSLCLVGASVSANLFTNPDFETLDFTGWEGTNTARGVGWPGAVTVFDVTGAGPTTAATFAVGRDDAGAPGNQGIVLYQSVRLMAGQNYRIEVAVAAENRSNLDYLQGGDFELVVGPAAIGYAAAGYLPAGSVYRSTISVDYLATITDDYFLGVRITRPFTAEADLRQYATAFSAVPEPGTLLGFAALAALVRMRKR
jgi:hypothetical protein